MTWQVTSFYSPLTKEPEMEIHSGSGEGSEPSEKKNENNSVTWTKIRVPGNDAPGERSTEIPLGPPPTPYLGGASLWPPFSTVSEGLAPSQRPITFKNGTSRAKGTVTEKPANTPLPLGEDHQPAYSKKPVNPHPTELPSNMNLTQSSGPVLTKEDATSLMAEGFLLNASDYKHLSMGRSPAYWIVGNWSEVRVLFLTQAWFYMELARGVAFLCRFPNGLEKMKQSGPCPHLPLHLTPKIRKKKSPGKENKCSEIEWGEPRTKSGDLSQPVCDSRQFSLPLWTCFWTTVKLVQITSFLQCPFQLQTVRILWWRTKESIGFKESYGRTWVHISFRKPMLHNWNGNLKQSSLEEFYAYFINDFFLTQCFLVLKKFFWKKLFLTHRVRRK